MLETFYNSLGFFGTIFVAFLSFSIFIFWIAGIAGIADLPESKEKTTKLILCVLIPPYAFIWLFYDMYQQNKMMNKED